MPFDEVLEYYGSKVSSNEGEVYFNLPFWFRVTSGNNLEIFHFDKLPQALTDIIQKERDGE